MSPPDSSPTRLSKHLVAGSLAGVVATFALHPLDSIKVRRQAFAGKSSSVTTFGALKTVIRSEGLSALYLGLGPALLANGLSWGAYFFFYEACKQRTWNDVRGHLLSGVLAGGATVTMTNPIWLIKTRMQLESVGSRGYKSVGQSLGRILKEEGFRGLYRGLLPAYALTTHGAVQFAAYEECKRLYSRNKTPTSNDALAYSLFGAVSKVVATTVTYPAQVIKTRMQQRIEADSQYRRTLSTVKTVFNGEGIYGFYKGLGANLWRVAPQSALMFGVYEEVYKGLNVFIVDRDLE